nr:hypothetical protein ISGA_10505 [Gordonia sp. NB41Y]
MIRLDPAQTRALATEPVRQVTTSVLDASSAADGPPAALMAAALDAQFVTWFAERITKSDPQSCMEVSVADGGGVTSLHGRGPCPWGSASITRGAVHSDPYA